MLTEPGSIGLLNCMANAALVPTVCPPCTLGFTTYGALKSGPAMVVNVVDWLVTATPATLVTPLIAIVISVLAGSGACGTIITRV